MCGSAIICVVASLLLVGSMTKFTIYEASNESRREVYIGTTTLSMSALIASFREAPPRGARGWRPQDVTFRSLEFGVLPADTPAHVRRHAATRKGWRVIKARKAMRVPKAA